MTSHWPIRFLVFSQLLTASAEILAVAGGGGGGFDLGGDGDVADVVLLILQIALWIIFELPFPWNLLGLAVLFAVVWLAGKRVRASSGLNRIPSMGKVPALIESIDPAFLHRNPDFAVEPFRAKVNTAFLAIQNAWTAQDLAPVRRWISDGVWQRFNTQFAMMRLLEQRNVVSAIEVRRIFIDRIEQDGFYDVVQVGIHFTAHDDFVSAKYPELDQRGPLELLEYWSFIRKSGITGKDLFHSNLCPSCGTPLPTDMGEVARCGSCSALSTLGDYDWVLAEITQADDYANESFRLRKAGALTQRIRTALAAEAGLAVQWIEDKAANAWLQILRARVTHAPERLRRFVSDDLYATLARAIETDPPAVYNRLYLNHVTLIDHFRRDGQDHLVVAVRFTAQRVEISTGELRQIDHAPYASDAFMILARDVGAGRPLGSIYAHACPACGAPVGDTLDLKCTYCGSVLNSTQHEWIVTRLLRPEEYRALTVEEKPALQTHVQADGLDPLFRARDFAFNNVMVMLGADGAITLDEVNFAQDLSRRMGYDARKLAGMLELARQRKLTLRLPEDRKMAAKMLALMEKAAAADRRTTPAEQALLAEVRQRVEADAA